MSNTDRAHLLNAFSIFEISNNGNWAPGALDSFSQGMSDQGRVCELVQRLLAGQNRAYMSISIFSALTRHWRA